MTDLSRVRDLPFCAIGYRDGLHKFVALRSGDVVEINGDGRPRSALTRLAPIRWWRRYFPSRGASRFDIPGAIRALKKLSQDADFQRIMDSEPTIPSAMHPEPPVDIDREAVNAAAMAAGIDLLMEWFPNGRCVDLFVVENWRGERGKTCLINIQTGAWQVYRFPSLPIELRAG